MCRGLREDDILISVNDYGGVSKVEIEAALVGMPTITNSHPREERPEILEENCLAVEGDAASYRGALETLLADVELRERMGTRLRDSARAIEPARMEAAYASLYRELAAA